jgi:hypothetical protein
MAVSVALTPGRTIRWRKRRFVVVHSTGFDAIIAREVGKRCLARIPVSEARPDHATGRRAASATDLVSLDEEEWQTAVKRFSILKPLFEMDKAEARRGRVIKPNDFRRRNHYRIRIAVLLHGHQQGSADIRPGHTEQVTASGNSIRQVCQRQYFDTMTYRSTANGG